MYNMSQQLHDKLLSQQMLQLYMQSLVMQLHMQSLVMQQLTPTSCDTTAKIIVCNIKTVFRQYYRNYTPSASTPV